MIVVLGGKGSGNFGHAGRPGQVGGSLPAHASKESAEAGAMNYLRRRPEAHLHKSYNEAAKAEGRASLSPAEFHVLRGYMDNDYLAINLPLRDQGFAKTKDGKTTLKPFGEDKTTSNLSGAVETLNRALDKMPVYKGKVHRLAAVPDEKLRKVLEIYTPGATITEPGFMSASSKRVSPEVFGGLFASRDPNLRFVIDSKNARSVSFTYLMAHPTENEVIFKSGTRFKVRSVAREGKVHVINLSEVKS